MEEREYRTAGHRQPAENRPAGTRPDVKRPTTSGTRNKRPKHYTRHVSKKSRRSRKRRRNFIIRIFIIALFVLLVAGLLFFWKKYGSSKEMADLKNYYGIEKDDDLAVIVDDKVIGSKKGRGAGGKIYDGVPYIEYTVVRDFINSWFYWDHNENLLLYTMPNGSVTVEVGEKEYTDVKEKKSKKYTILKTEGKTAYIALPFIKEYTDMLYTIYESDGKGVPTRAVVDCDRHDRNVSTLKRKTPLRQEKDVKSPIITKAKKSDKVWVLKEEDGWLRLRTEDGYIGYAKDNSIRKQRRESATSEFEEPTYTNISEDYIINLALHNIDNGNGSGSLLETIAKTKGLTTIAPTWFSVNDVNGNMTSISDSDYVNYAHQSGIDVWAVLRDYGSNGISSNDETMELLSYTSRREKLINQLIAEALKTGIDGIDIDFKCVSKECGDHFIQFIRELSVKCRQNGLVLAVSNKVPTEENSHYRLKEQAKVADYIILMAYDEHDENSPEAGSVSSYEYVEKGISDACKYVPKTKLVCSLPFYTRLWVETPKTEQELEAEKDTEAANYPNKIKSTTYGMDSAQKVVEDSGAELIWDDKAKQYYAQWEYNGSTYKIWLEEEDSLTEKLKLIKGNNLAGVASRRLGLEKSGIWDLILQYVN